MSEINLSGLTLNEGQGGADVAYEIVDGRVLPISKVVFGGAGVVVSSWSHGAGAIDNGTPRVCLPSDQLSQLATAANQATANGHLATLAGAVAAAKLQAELAAAIPAGDNAIGRLKLTDGTLVASLRDLTSAKPLDVAIVDANGDQITSFGGGSGGGGTEYDASTPHTAAEKLSMAGVVRQDTPASLVDSDGDRTELSVDALGRLYCNVHTSALPTGAATAANQTTANGHLATLAGAVAGSEMQVDVLTLPNVTIGSALPAGTNNIGDVDVLTLPGTAAAGALSLPDVVSVVAGSDGTAVVPIATDDAGIVQTNVTNLATITEYQEDVVADADPAGGALILVRTDTPAGRTSADGDHVAACGTDRGEQLVKDLPAPSGGLLMHKTISAASMNATSVKASAGQVYGIQAFNSNAAARYLKLYDEASAPTVGTDTPVKTILLPPDSSGVVIPIEKGLAFANGIAFALTTGIADDDTGAVAADEIVVNLDYF